MEQEVVYLGILLFPYSLGDGLSGLYVLLYSRKEFNLAFNLDNEPDHGLNIGLDHDIANDLDLDHDIDLDIDHGHDMSNNALSIACIIIFVLLAVPSR